MRSANASRDTPIQVQVQVQQSSNPLQAQIQSTPIILICDVCNANCSCNETCFFLETSTTNSHRQMKRIRHLVDCLGLSSAQQSSPVPHFCGLAVA